MEGCSPSRIANKGVGIWNWLRVRDGGKGRKRGGKEGRRMEGCLLALQTRELDLAERVRDGWKERRRDGGDGGKEDGGKEERREGGKEGRREGGKEGRRDGGMEMEGWKTERRWRDGEG
jgi:hypothetical protein